MSLEKFLVSQSNASTKKKEEKSIKEIIQERQIQYQLQSCVEEQEKASIFQARDSARSFLTSHQNQGIKNDWMLQSLGFDTINSDQQENLQFIPCINCQEHVPIQQVDHHSLICNTVSVIVRKMKKSTIMKEIDFKLQKILNLFQIIIKSITKSQQNSEIKLQCLPLFTELKAHVKSAIEIQKYGQQSLVSLLELKQNISTIQNDSKNYTGGLIYIERVKLLLDLKYIEIDKNMLEARQNRFNRTTSSGAQNFSEIFKNDTQQYSLESNSFQSQYLKFRENSQQSFEFSSVDRGNFSFSHNHDNVMRTNQFGDFGGHDRFLSPQTSFSKTQHVYESMTENKISQSDAYFANENTNDSIDDSVQQRQFFAICLTLKLNYPSHSKLQKIPISLLYQQAMFKQIPKESWQQFILFCFQRPDEFLDQNTSRGTISSLQI